MLRLAPMSASTAQKNWPSVYRLRLCKLRKIIFTMFVIFLFAVPALVGLALILLTQKRIYLSLHDKAMQTNPIYKWTFPRSTKNQRRVLTFGRFLLRGIGILSLIIAVLLLGILWHMHASPFRGETFEQGKWELQGSCQGLSDWECVQKEASCPRGGMVRDLARNYLIPETVSRDEVYALLGRTKGTVKINGQSCIAYTLGMCSGLGIDYDSLYVCFDSNDRISSAGHVQH